MFCVCFGDFAFVRSVFVFDSLLDQVVCRLCVFMFVFCHADILLCLCVASVVLFVIALCCCFVFVCVFRFCCLFCMFELLCVCLFCLCLLCVFLFV